MYKDALLEIGMLKRLSDERIFAIEFCKNKNAVEIYERCDDYFGVILNKSELLELITAFQNIADELQELSVLNKERREKYEKEDRIR